MCVFFFLLLSLFLLLLLLLLLVLVAAVLVLALVCSQLCLLVIVGVVGGWLTVVPFSLSLFYLRRSLLQYEVAVVFSFDFC